MDNCFIIEKRSKKCEKRFFVAQQTEERWAAKDCSEYSSFWDVVGDEIMASAMDMIKAGGNCHGRTMFLLPEDAGSETEGSYYNRETIQELSLKMCYRMVLVEDSDHIYRNLKGDTEHMKEKVSLPSLAYYRQQKNLPDVEQRIKKSEVVYENQQKDMGISPFSETRVARISENAHKNALRFAHPVDQSIISALDNPVVNGVFNKVVQASIDANYGLALAKGIHISANTYGELYDIVCDCAEKLDIPIPYVMISDTVQGINACTAGTDQFAFIAISSFLPVVMKKDELSFVIGHECGHLVLGHVVYHTALNVIGSAGGLLPLVGSVVEKTIKYPLNAWSRRSEISADRAGLICCGDIQTAKRSLFKLEAGLLKTDGVDIDGYVREAEQVLDSTSIGKYSEIMYSHPIIPKRIKALDYFSRSKLYDDITGLGNADNGRLLSDSELASEVEKIIEI